LTLSGAMYPEVPTSDPVMVFRFAPAELAIPKSVSNALPSGRSSRLPGLTSRWVTPLSWAACSASAASATRRIVASALSRPTLARVRASDSPSMYFMTR